MIVNGKTVTFKKFFKELHLADKIEKINGKDCYKLTAITNKNNPLNINAKFIYWIDYNNFLDMKRQFVTELYGKLYKYQTFFAYRLNNKGEYEEKEIKEIMTPINKNKPYLIRVIKRNKIVREISVDESMFKMPKDKNDYKKLQAYFNGLLRKYYDSKYQIKIK